MERKEVYNAIDTERDYQIIMTENSDRPDMIEDLHVGDSIAAMEHILSEARKAWYSGSAPHQDSMEYIRKIAGLSVQLGETYGMPKRKITKQEKVYGLKPDQG